MAIVLASCSAETASVRTHSVRIAAFAFAPAELAVAPGDTVIFTNADFVAHTATERGRFDSGELDGGEEWRWVATPGRHEYLCALHPTMTGTIVVD